MPAQPLNVFISYSHNEEDRILLDELVTHMAPLKSSEQPLIRVWDDSYIKPGDPWDEEIKENLKSAHIVLLLISSDFNASRYIREVEMKEAFERHQRKECRIIPILLRPCNFKGMPYEQLEILPKYPTDQRLEPVVNVNKWLTQDFALTTVVGRLRQLIEEVNMQPSMPQSTKQPPTPTHWEAFFRDRPDKKRSLRLLDTVNCNRHEYFKTQLQAHFETHKDQAGNILYLLTACETQKPASLAKRLAYWFDEEIGLFFRPQDDTKKDELAFFDLALDKNTNKTFGNFWELMQNNFLHNREVDFDSFADDPGKYLTLPGNTRALVTFQISESDFLEYEAERHIAYILEQFAKLPDAFHRFVFCFVLHFHDLHEGRRAECTDILDSLDKFTQRPAENAGWRTGLHINCLPPLPQDDVKVWWNARFDHRNFTDAVNKLLDHVHPDKQEVCRQNASFDMEPIEEMQYAAYTFYLNQY